MCLCVFEGQAQFNSCSVGEMDGVLRACVVYGACAQLLTLPDRIKRQFAAASEGFLVAMTKCCQWSSQGFVLLKHLFTFEISPSEG